MTESSDTPRQSPVSELAEKIETALYENPNFHSNPRSIAKQNAEIAAQVAEEWFLDFFAETFRDAHTYRTTQRATERFMELFKKEREITESLTSSLDKAREGLWETWKQSGDDTSGWDGPQHPPLEQLIESTIHGVKRLREDYDEAGDEIESLQEENERLRKRHDLLSTAGNVVSDVSHNQYLEIESLQEENKRLKHKVEYHKSENDILTDILEKEETELSQRKRFDEIAQDLLSDPKTHDPKGTHPGYERLRELEQQLTVLQEQIESLQEQLTATKKVIEAARIAQGQVSGDVGHESTYWILRNALREYDALMNTGETEK